MSSGADIEVGDLVKFTRVFRVTSVDDWRVDGTDEKSGGPVTFIRRHDRHAMKFEVLHRPKWRPGVGSTITGQQVVDTPWRQGTVLQNVGRRSFVFVLTADGKWVNQQGERFGFDVFEPDVDHIDGGTYTIIHLPGVDSPMKSLATMLGMSKK